MTNNLLEAFDRAYQNLQLQPLVTQEDLNKFRVPYAGRVLAELKELVRSCTSGNDKIIFAGHRGCGKTTLLAEFSTGQEQQYFVVFFSISDMIEMSDIDHIKILFAIAVQMMDKAEQQKIDIPKSLKDKFYNWFATRSKINIEEARAELGAGFDLLKIIKGKLKTDAVTRSEIKLELERHFSELIERINEIASTVETATGKKILVIIDDLDKLDLALVEKIYRDNVKALFAPQFRIIFTIPIAVNRLRLARGEPSLRAAIDRQVQADEYLLQGKTARAVFTVVGAEDLSYLSRNSERSEQDKFFGYLQWTREGLRAFPYPIVLWITYDIFAKFNTKAPDFWSWRKGVFLFLTRQVSVRNIIENNIRFGNNDNFDKDESLSLEDLQYLIDRTKQVWGDKEPKLATLYKNVAKIYMRRLETGESENYRQERELAIDYFQRASALQKEFGSKLDLVDTLNQLGQLYVFQGRGEEAIELHQEALAIAKEIGDRFGEGNSLTYLGNVYNILGEYHQSVQLYQQSLTIAMEIGDLFALASSFSNLANAYICLGQYQQALQLYEQSLQIAREIGDRTVERNCLGNLGGVYHSLGQYQQALNFCEQSLEITREIGDKKGEGNGLGNLGNVYSSLRQYEQALDFYQQSLKIAREIGDKRGEGICIGSLGNVYFLLGNYQEALTFFQQSLQIFQEICDRSGEVNSLSNIGKAYFFMEQYERAIQLYKQSLNIANEIGDRFNEANSLNSLGLAYYSLGQYKLAIALYQQSLAIARIIGNPSGEANTLNNLGNAYQSIGEYQQANLLFEQSRKISFSGNKRSSL